MARAILGGRLTAVEASRELGSSVEAVRRWVRRERRATFVAVEVADPAPAGAAVVEVLLARGRVLRVPIGIDASSLVRLVRALESC